MRKPYTKMTASRIHVRRIFALALLTAFCHVSVAAQAYPDQTITLVVPFSPGGTSDIPARLIAKELTDAWGQPVVVENRPGATGMIGEHHVAKSPPDGYTLLMGTTSSHTMAVHMLESPPYHPQEDLRAVSLFGWVRHLVVVNPALPVQTLDDLITLAKEQPGALNYSTSGNGSSIHLATESFNRLAGITMNHIPYRGVNPAAMAVVSGEVDLMFAPGAVVLPHIENDSLRPLVALTPDRFYSLPNVPTIAEAGFPQYEANTWIGLLAPAGTPDLIVTQLHDALVNIAEHPSVQESLDAVSIDLRVLPSDQSDRIIDRELTEYAALIDALGLKPR